MTTLSVNEIKSVGLTDGNWYDVQPGSLSAIVAEVLGERCPCLSFTDATTGRKVVAPRASVTGFDGIVEEVRDAEEIKADAARLARQQWLAEGATEVQVNNATCWFLPGWHFSDSERSEMLSLLDQVEGGRIGPHNVAVVVDRLLDAIVIDGQKVAEPRELLRRSPSIGSALLHVNFIGRLRQILGLPRPLQAA
jgi:hypothetical protein